MPTLLLINPGPRRYRIARRGFKVQPLGLAYVAALTPPTWTIRICDENFDLAEPQPNADLVGITTLTSTVNRAYELAQAYRAMKIPVVLGGIHASMAQDEADAFADAVVVGEAESVWPAVLDDALRGQLQRRYRGEHLPFRQSVFPRRDLLSTRYSIGSIQTSRGCPLDCEFCSVRAFNGGTFRQRDVDDVLKELRAIPQNLVFFTDDNLVGYSRASRERAKELFRGMIRERLGKRWMCQASINMADDDELLRLAGRSGCMLVLVGIESVDENVLAGHMNKQVNRSRGVAYYDAFIQKLHRQGIVVLGTMVFGSDEESADIFAKTEAFYRRSGLDVPWPGFLTPYPGTALFRRLLADGRVAFTHFPDDWEKYNSTPVVRPPNRSREGLCADFMAFSARVFSRGHCLRRALRALVHSRSPVRAALVYSLNRSLEKRFRDGILPYSDADSGQTAPDAAQ